ncbi:MAG: LamB/YcsF family protein, partial [Bacillota bacterium]|nr:LamB/YcsF family protein [Bacillota bacterium]
FADREYNDDGTLVSRSIKNSVITNKDRCVDRVINMIMYNYVETINGKKIEIIPDTICVHGDNENSLELIKEIRKKLEKTGIEVSSFNVKG